jgi:hypothetical protein
VEAFVGVVVDAGEDDGEPGFGVNGVELCGFDERVDGVNPRKGPKSDIGFGQSKHCVDVLGLQLFQSSGCTQQFRHH